ncbi:MULTISPECIES: hypothetical protein [Trichocoleus]|uniref:Uncharacterized protein n=1 Tax=Trichocoleus desertorum GB2-A4 TaxID=2933944 RepID=A0ABV0JFC1_9CYAN|nr:hypothetical protein [Trichocoleus sp. FACHB-46]MBD1864535.1 hypothetical protein [Trichocoleus sp. FACHB-46]
MTIYTPGGRPIDIPTNYAFTLLARLYPRYYPHKVLKIAEAIAEIPVAVTYLLTSILFAVKAAPIVIFAGVLVTLVAFFLMQIHSKYISPIVTFGIIFNSIDKWRLSTHALVLLGWYSSGWKGPAAFTGAMLIAVLVKTILEAQEKSRIRAVEGARIYSKFERCFIDAYRFCANKAGITLDLNLSEEEIESNRWQIAYDNYRLKNPTLFEVKQFT